jgi:hypothetical protein
MTEVKLVVGAKSDGYPLWVGRKVRQLDPPFEPMWLYTDETLSSMAGFAGPEALIQLVRLGISSPFFKTEMVEDTDTKVPVPEIPKTGSMADSATHTFEAAKIVEQLNKAAETE